MAQLEKDRKRKALQKEKARAQMSNSQLQEHCAQERACVRKYKEKKQTESLSDPLISSNDSTPYRCTQNTGNSTKICTSKPTSISTQTTLCDRNTSRKGWNFCDQFKSQPLKYYP